MTEELQLLSIGDVTMDVFLDPAEHDEFCNLETKDQYICFSYGDKIPVKHIEYSIGGNAANNAVGTSRLGVNAGIVTTLGNDATGEQVHALLTMEEIDLSYTAKQENAGSNYSTIVSYGGERTIFTYHAPRTYQFPVNLPAVPWVYLTSMGESFQPFYNSFVDWMKRNPEVKVAFNPGSRQLRSDRKIIDPVLANTHIVYINRKEAEMLTGMQDTKDKEKDLLKAMAETGPRIVIVTDGAGGSYVYDQERFYHAGILPIDSHERTGAGDAFGAGCIAALIKDKPWEEALLWGTVNSASVIGYTGAQKGLLREEDMETWIARAKSCDVVVNEF